MWCGVVWCGVVCCGVVCGEVLCCADCGRSRLRLSGVTMSRCLSSCWQPWRREAPLLERWGKGEHVQAEVLASLVGV